jgi:bacterioferritin-associated ferredoxin
VFACICRAVTSDQVTAAIDEGAATIQAVARATGACTAGRCGHCRERIAGMIGERAQACALMAALGAPTAAAEAAAA